VPLLVSDQRVVAPYPAKSDKRQRNRFRCLGYHPRTRSMVRLEWHTPTLPAELKHFGHRKGSLHLLSNDLLSSVPLV
jgi:hypothetical protein